MISAPRTDSPKEKVGPEKVSQEAIPRNGNRDSLATTIERIPERVTHLDTLRERFTTRMPLVRWLSKVAGITRLAVHRLLHYPGLSLLALIGVILAVGLVTSAGFFAQAVDKVMLTREMAEYSRITNRPPFASRVYTFSSRQIPLTLERAERLANDVTDTLSSEIRLPVASVGMMIDSGVLQLTSDTKGQAASSGLPLGQKSSGSVSASQQDINLIYRPDIAKHMEILEGDPVDDSQSGESLDVWMHTLMAQTTGAQIGEEFQIGPKSNPTAFTAVLKGIWQPVDSEDRYWLSNPEQTLGDKFLVRRNDYMTHVEPFLDVKVRAVTWLVVLDELAVVPARARDYAQGFERAEAVILKYLPDARVTLPSVSLGKFVDRQTTLTTLLLGFNVPALGFLLYFLILTSAVIAYWQRRETTVLVRRGMNRPEVFSLNLTEGLLLFLVGAPIGLFLGIQLARMMGYATSFLRFTEREALPVSIYGINWTLILATLGVILFTKLWTAGSIDRRNIVSQEREHVRPPRGPFWYRNYLDLLLLIPTYYGYQQLAQRGSLADLVTDSPQEIFSDPLLIVLPALFIVALALLSMRVFGLLMKALDRLSSHVGWLPLHLSLRQLGRHSHTYINPLLLVIVSLGLGIYTLSMAASLDQWLEDRMYHLAGADVSFKPYLETEMENAAQSVGSEAPDILSGGWIPPIGDYEDLPGVAAATRVGDYEALIHLVTGGGRTVEGRFLAIDRVDFAEVAWFRHDFAREPLGALMNRLAGLPDGILVSQEFLDQNGLHINDKISIQVVTSYGASFTDQFTVVGVYNHFPTVYEESVTVVGNLDHIFSFFGQTMFHDIWLRTDSDVTGREVISVIPDTGIDSIGELDAVEMVMEEQAKMERVGVFGTLSVSFLAATLMAALGLLTYSYASLQERRFHFAILRAGGLGNGQIIGQVSLEYILLTLFGATAGIFIGSWTAEFFVPMFRIANESRLAMPPLIPIIAQNEVVALALIFAGVMILLEVILIGTALYQRMFDALRLGF